MEAVKRMAANPKDVVHNLPRCLISLGRLGGKRALEGWRNKWWELKASNVVLLTKCKKRKSLLIKSGRSAGHESQADLRKEILQRTPFYVGPCWPCQRHLVLFCWQDLEGQGLLAGLSRTGWGEKRNMASNKAPAHLFRTAFAKQKSTECATLPSSRQPCYGHMYCQQRVTQTVNEIALIKDFASITCCRAALHGD